MVSEYVEVGLWSRENTAASAGGNAPMLWQKLLLLMIKLLAMVAE